MIMSNTMIVALAVIIGVIVILLVGKIFLLPLKWVLRLVGNILIGGIIIVVINGIGQFFNFQLSLNLYSALIVGLLGVPGVALLFVLKYIL